MKQKVLFLCTGNSARSQMAEALLRHLAGNRFEVFSAGLEPKGVNPFAIKAINELDINMEGHSSKLIDVYIGKVDFDYLITVCSNADQNCPFFPGMGKRLHWPFEDPAAVEGTDEEKLAAFREIRNQIQEQIEKWLLSV